MKKLTYLVFGLSLIAFAGCAEQAGAKKDDKKEDKKDDKKDEKKDEAAK